MRKCCNSYQSTNKDSQWDLHVKTQLFPPSFPNIYCSKEFFVQSNDNFHNKLPGNLYQFSLALKRKKKHRDYNFGKVLEKGNDYM